MVTYSLFIGVKYQVTTRQENRSSGRRSVFIDLPMIYAISHLEKTTDRSSTTMMALLCLRRRKMT